MNICRRQPLARQFPVRDLGARYMYANLSADATGNDFNGNLGWKTHSVSLYA